MNPETLFLECSRDYLGARGSYFPRIEKAVARLRPEDLWWRPNDASNSVGNLLLHLAGNLRQWVVHGVGGAPDVRDRPAEFDAEGATSADELLGRLRAAVEEAGAVLETLDPARLAEPVVIQGMETTVLGALYHAVEHFSMHTGQILYIVKMRRGVDLGFYSIGQDGTAEEGW
ncbi:MAG TPA: DinB family protein [Longimicrobiales bacterium]|nr:DinB family protein [Longimicrobiales bacterium]